MWCGRFHVFQFSNTVISNERCVVRTAKRAVVKFKLIFTGRSGSNRRAFYLYRNPYPASLTINNLFLTGGSEWTLEDTIELKNISIPDRKTEIDLSLIYNNERNLNDPGTDSGTVLVSAQ